MRLRWLLLFAALLSGLSHAEPLGAEAAASPAPALVAIERQGYAFDYPRILTRQRLFGIIHGVGLLAATCQENLPAEQAKPLQEAYLRWLKLNESAIRQTQTELAHFYFGEHAADANATHLVRALGLHEKLDLAKETPDMQAACLTFVPALSKPRYDIGKQFKLAEAIAKVSLVVRFEAQIQACRGHLPAEQFSALLDRHAQWLAEQETAPSLARAWLIEHWKQLDLDEQPQAWLAGMHAVYAHPTQNNCLALPAQLASPHYNLLRLFSPAPETLPEEAAPTPVIVEDTPRPQEASVPAAPESELTAQPSVFDLLKRLLDGPGPAQQQPDTAHP